MHRMWGSFIRISEYLSMELLGDFRVRPPHSPKCLQNRFQNCNGKDDGAFPNHLDLEPNFRKGQATPGCADAPVTYHLTKAGDQALRILNAVSLNFWILQST